MSQFPNQWYNKNPRRYQQERDLVMRTFRTSDPKEMQLPDGRRGFRLTLRMPDPEGEIVLSDGSHMKPYTVLMVWDTNHPNNAANQYGGSIKCYFVNPTITDMEYDFCTKHSRSYIPHLLSAPHPSNGTTTRIPCTQQLGQSDERFTMVEAVGLVTNWLANFTASKYRLGAYVEFCKH